MLKTNPDGRDTWIILRMRAYSTSTPKTWMMQETTQVSTAVRPSAWGQVPGARCQVPGVPPPPTLLLSTLADLGLYCEARFSCQSSL